MRTLKLGMVGGGNGAFFAVPDLPSPAPSLHYVICTAGAVPQLVPTT